MIKAKILNPKASKENSLVYFLVIPVIFLALWLGTSSCIYFIQSHWLENAHKSLSWSCFFVLPRNNSQLSFSAVKNGYLEYLLCSQHLWRCRSWDTFYPVNSGDLVESTCNSKYGETMTSSQEGQLALYSGGCSRADWSLLGHVTSLACTFHICDPANAHPCS